MITLRITESPEDGRTRPRDIPKEIISVSITESPKDERTRRRDIQKQMISKYNRITRG